MLNIKHGDTDGSVTFTLAVAGVAIPLTDSTVTIVLVNKSTSARYAVEIDIEDAASGEATWTPIDTDWESILPGDYNLEAVIERTSGAQRAVPTRGYDQAKVWPTL